MSDQINIFLQKNGISLKKHGSNELGLSPSKAIEFLNVLHLYSEIIVGLEEWHKSGENYLIYSLGGWYSDSLEIDKNHADSKSFIKSSNFPVNTLLTVQHQGINQ